MRIGENSHETLRILREFSPIQGLDQNCVTFCLYSLRYRDLDRFRQLTRLQKMLGIAFISNTPEHWIRHDIGECLTCGEIRVKKMPDLRQLVSGGVLYEVDESRWPPNLSFGIIQELGIWIASPTCLEAWRKHKFTGLTFSPIGRWV